MYVNMFNNFNLYILPPLVTAFMSVPASISFSAHSTLFHLHAECKGVH